MTIFRLNLLRTLIFCSIVVPQCVQGQEAKTVNAPSTELNLPDTDEGLPGEGPIRRYDWFRNLWNAKRAQWAQQIERDQDAVVFLGDSITQGWGDDFRGAFGDLKVANRGISGDTTRGMLVRLAGDVLALQPRGVVMLMGTNDLEEGAEPEVIARNFTLILKTLSDINPQMPIVVSLTFPSAASKSRPTSAIQAMNKLYAESARNFPQVIVLDTFTLFANEQGDAKPEEFPDLLHPNELGYAKWTAALRPIFATLGWLETEPDSFAIEAGYRALFNGRDLSGWGLRPSSKEDIESSRRWKESDPNAPPWPIVTEPVSFNGKSQSDDGRYVARNGRLVVTTPVEGRRIQQLWTTDDFSGDFELKLEFRATPNADSGVFLRGKQLQCRDYLLAGPYKQLTNYKPGDWNELVVSVRGNKAQCTCNGEVLEEAFELPVSGPIGLEGDRGQMEYRRIRIRTTDR